MICGHKQGREGGGYEPELHVCRPVAAQELIVLARHLSAFERVVQLFNTGLRGAELQRYAARITPQ